MTDRESDQILRCKILLANVQVIAWGDLVHLSQHVHQNLKANVAIGRTVVATIRRRKVLSPALERIEDVASLEFNKIVLCDHHQNLKDL